MKKPHFKIERYQNPDIEYWKKQENKTWNTYAITAYILITLAFFNNNTFDFFFGIAMWLYSSIPRYTYKQYTKTLSTSPKNTSSPDQTTSTPDPSLAQSGGLKILNNSTCDCGETHK